jgi:ABC-type transport system substrate-binding protein
MPATFNPDLFAARWYCSFLYPEEMPLFAADALEAGYDGPALRRLAGMVKPTSTDIGDLFKQSLTEIGTVTIHNAEQAAVLLARTTAQDIVEGRIDPLKGSILLAGLASAMDYPAYLNPFYEFAEMPHWGEYAPPRAQLIEDIIKEARLLLASVSE